GNARHGLLGAKVRAHRQRPDGIWDAKGRRKLSRFHQPLDDLIDPLRRTLPARTQWLNVRPQLLGKTERKRRGELVPSLGNAARPRVPKPEGPIAPGFAARNPISSHVLEPERARSLAAQIVDQLAEDPLLVGVGNPPVALLHNRLGQNTPP